MGLLPDQISVASSPDDTPQMEFSACCSAGPLPKRNDGLLGVPLDGDFAGRGQPGLS
jgi:hypothetical protein